MIRQPTKNDHFLLAITVLIFSQSFVSLRIVAPELGTLWTIAFRVGIALAVLLPWSIWRGFEWPRQRRVWKLVISLAVLNVIVPFMFFTWGLETISAGEAALVLGAIPLFGLFVSHFATGDDRFTMNKLAGVGLGLAGIAILFGGAALSGGNGKLLPYGSVLLAALCYAVSGGIVRKLDGFPPVRLTALIYLLSLPVLLAAALIFGDPISEPPSTWVIGNLVCLGLLPSGIGYILRFKLIPAIGYSYFSLAMNLLPVSGVILGAILLGESITAPMLAALALILAGLAVARMR